MICKTLGAYAQDLKQKGFSDEVIKTYVEARRNGLFPVTLKGGELAFMDIAKDNTIYQPATSADHSQEGDLTFNGYPTADKFYKAIESNNLNNTLKLHILKNNIPLTYEIHPSDIKRSSDGSLNITFGDYNYDFKFGEVKSVDGDISLLTESVFIKEPDMLNPNEDVVYGIDSSTTPHKEFMEYINDMSHEPLTNNAHFSFISDIVRNTKEALVDGFDIKFSSAEHDSKDVSHIDGLTYVVRDSTIKNLPSFYAEESIKALIDSSRTSNDKNTIATLNQLDNIRSTFVHSVSEQLSETTSLSDVRNLLHLSKEKFNSIFTTSKDALPLFLSEIVTNPEFARSLSKVKIEEPKAVTGHLHKTALHGTYFDKAIYYVSQLLSKLHSTLMNIDHSAPSDLVRSSISYYRKLVNIENARKAYIEKTISDSSFTAKKIKGIYTSGQNIVANTLKKSLKGVEVVLDKVETSKTDKNMVSNLFGDRSAEIYSLLKHVIFSVDGDTRQKALSDLGFSSTGLLRSVLKDLQGLKPIDYQIQKMHGALGNLDRHREALATSAHDSINMLVEGGLTARDSRALEKSLMATDWLTLQDKGFSRTDALKFLKGEGVDEQINKYKELIRKESPLTKNYLINQAKALAKASVFGEYSESVFDNSTDIVRSTYHSKLHSNSPSYNEAKLTKLETLVDVLATFESLKMVDKKDLEHTHKFLTRSPEFTDTFLDHLTHLNHATLSAEHNMMQVSDSTRNKTPKAGYTKLVNNDVHVMVDYTDNKELRKLEGYEIIRSLPESKGLSIYRSLPQTYNRSYSGLIKPSYKNFHTTDLDDHLYLIKHNSYRDNLISKASKDSVSKLARDVLKLNSAEGIELPSNGKRVLLNGVFEPHKVVSELNLQEQEKYLGREYDLIKNLATRFSSSASFEESYHRNNTLAEFIEQDYLNNFQGSDKKGKNGFKYVEISEFSPDAKIRKIYKTLPEQIKDKFSPNGGEDSYKHSLFVNENLMLEYFGFRDPSIANLIPILPTVVNKTLYMVEEAWKSLVSSSVSNILIRYPAVAVSNFTSNFMYALSAGMSPVEIYSSYRNNIQHLKNYDRDLNIFNKLALNKSSLEITDSSKTSPEYKKVLLRYNSQKSKLLSNPLHELFENGIIELVDAGFNLSGDTMKKIDVLDRFLPDHVSNKIVKVGETLLLSKNTTYYQAMTKALHSGDLLAQAVLNGYLKKQDHEQLKEYRDLMFRHYGKTTYNTGKMKAALKSREKQLTEVRLNKVRNAFIFYSTPHSGLESYLNRIGLVMFTKYLKRIQRVTRNLITTKPLNTAAVHTLAKHSPIPLNDVIDQTLISKTLNYGNPLWLRDFDDIYKAAIPPIVNLGSGFF